MTMSTLYLAQAQRAIDYVKAKMPVGASNRDDNPRQAEARPLVEFARLDTAELIRQGAKHPGKTIVNEAVARGAGNCGEQVQVAFEYLKGLGVSPLDIFAYDQFSGKDHAWLVIGRPANAARRWIDRSWGDAVICDPWDNICQTALEDENVYGTARFALQKRWVRKEIADF